MRYTRPLCTLCGPQSVCYHAGCSQDTTDKASTNCWPIWLWKKAIITFLGCPLCERYCSKCLTFKPFKSSNHLSVKYFFPYSLLLLFLSRFSRVRLCATPTDAAHQAPLSLGFTRQESWSGLLFPCPMHACMLSCFSRVRLPYSL